MDEHKCPFSAPLVSRQFGCSRAREVVRRGGAEINCTDVAAHARCADLFQQLKLAALPAFGVEDDPLSMPHSVVIKIQYGGLLGLQTLLQAEARGVERVEDIQSLVNEVFLRYEHKIPCASLVDQITSFKTRARRGR